MNTCPVYRRSGGLSYGSTYAGPIGAILNPAHDLKRYSALPFASTMNGSCSNVCPVKIDIHQQIYRWRQIVAEKGELPRIKRNLIKIASKLLANPRLYRASVRSMNTALHRLPNILLYNPLNTWGKSRDLPDAPVQTFRDWYIRNRGKLAKDSTRSTHATKHRQETDDL